MKFTIWFALFVLVTFLAGHFLSYWMMMLVWAALGAALGESGTRAFFAAALGVGLTWLGQSFWISWETGSPLPDQMAGIMGMETKEVLMLITAVIGFVIGGCSALTGNRFRKLFERKQPYYF